MSNPACSFHFKFGLTPTPKGRPRFCRGRVVTPAATRAFEETLAFVAKRQFKGQPLEGPLFVGCVFTLEKPKSSKNEFPCVKPDIDNFSKAVFDALEGILWWNDSQIVASFCLKQYGVPGIELLVGPVESMGTLMKTCMGDTLKK